MSIKVTCRDCLYSFHVGEEFAGKSGRCPECNAVLEVPAPSRFAEPHDNPYGRHDDFDNDDHLDRLRPSRRPREEPEQRDDFDDYEEEDFGSRRPQIRFDPAARAARWKGVAAGLRNLMLATILFMLAQIVNFIYEVSTGMDEQDAENWTNLDLGIKVGYATFLAFAMLLWAWGRMRCASVPYVPARGSAYGSGILSALTALIGTLGLVGFVGGIFMVRNNPAGAVGIILLSICSLFFALGGFVIAEIMGQVSQTRMARGLKYPPFAKAARTQIVMACGLMLMGMFGLCVMMGVISKDAQQKQLQQQQQQNGAGAQQPPPPAPKGGFFKKGKGNNNNNQPAVVAAPPQGNPPNGPNGPNNPPPPEFDPKDHPGFFLAMRIAMLCSTLLYGFVSIVCYNLGRRAVEKEIHALVGDPHDQTGSEDEHF